MHMLIRVEVVVSIQESRQTWVGGHVMRLEVDVNGEIDYNSSRCSSSPAHIQLPATRDVRLGYDVRWSTHAPAPAPSIKMHLERQTFSRSSEGARFSQLFHQFLSTLRSSLGLTPYSNRSEYICQCQSIKDTSYHGVSEAVRGLHNSRLGPHLYITIDGIWVSWGKFDVGRWRGLRRSFNRLGGLIFPTVL